MGQITGSGIGNGTNYVMVDSSVGINKGRLMTAGSIVSMPAVSVSAGSESYIKGGSLIAMGVSGGTAYPLLTDTEGILQTSASVTTGSESWIKNYGDIGSSRVITNVIGVTPSGTFNVDISTSPVPISGTVKLSQAGTDNDVDISKSIGTLSPNNSSTSTLGSNVLFTGTADDIKDYAATNVSVFADQASAISGLCLEWSQDGTNWDEKMTVDIGASKVESYEFGVRARYFRILYRNGATTQGAFRLQTMYHPARTRQGARCLCVDIDDREFAPTRRAILAAQKPNTDYTNIQATAGGNLKISIEEFEHSGQLPSGTNLIGYVGVTPSGTFSTDINNPATIGSLAIQTIDGTVDVNGITTAGSLAIQTVNGTIITGSGVVMNAGSIQTYTQLGSVEVWQTTAGDMSVNVDSPTAIGSYTTQTVNATNLDIRDLANATDSVTSYINSPASIGSYTTQTVDGTVNVTGIATAGSLATQTVDGTVAVTGIATAGSLAIQTVDGTVTVTGIATAGSLAVQNIGDINFEDVGSPCFKQATATASGTYTQAWGIGGTGSKLEVHGYKISTQLAGYVRLLRSGGTPVVIADYYMAFASGGIVEKTFVTPIVPGGANIHVGFGTTVAGSTSLTVYGREIA